MTLPDKWVRKAIYSAINNIVVSGNTIKVYDTRVTATTIPKYYILMTTQTGRNYERTKCGDEWESSILLDIVTRYSSTGNTGSRLLADDIANAILPFLSSLQLDASSGLSIYKRDIDFPADLSTITDNENIFRKFIRVELTIN